MRPPTHIRSLPHGPARGRFAPGGAPASFGAALQESI